MAPKKSKPTLTIKTAKAAKTDGRIHGAAVITADPLAEAAAAAAAEKRKPYVKGCKSCEDWAAHHTNHLPCGHDQKK